MQTPKQTASPIGQGDTRRLDEALMETAIEYAVLLYPPNGRPRVIEIPKPPIGFEYPIMTFANRDDADAALKGFLQENPKYKRWVDGKILPDDMAT